MDRRVFMKSGALALVTMGLSPSFLRRTAFGGELLRGAALKGAARGKTLICLFQRGAADALNVVVPHGESAYYKLRPNIAIPRPALSAGATGAIDLDGFFGLHPSLAPLKPLWDRGCSRQFMPSEVRAPRGRTLMRRITWRPARPIKRERVMDGSTGISRSRAPAKLAARTLLAVLTAHIRRSARWP